MRHFSVLSNLLPKNDTRYKKWRESLKKRPASWCKGYTKETHPSITKISETFKRKKLDNFREWRDRMKELGKIRSKYPALKKNGDLAELIGVVLGDGHIEFFPRTESLTIACNAKNKGFIERYKKLMKEFFDKNPYEGRVAKNKNCVRLRVYQKNISKRLRLPLGSRKDINFKTPRWILKNKEHLKRYLRGLYEAEGSFCVHKPTYTYKFLFGNRNESLLNNVYGALKILGFHPHKSRYQIQVSKKKEVYRIKDLIKFRQY
jgi:DNA-binding transcriptional regulator WhiA